MKKIFAPLIIALLAVPAISLGTDFSDTDQMYGWNGSAQFWQTWADHKTQLGLLFQAKLTNPLVQTDVDDTPVDNVTTAPVSSNWAYDHAAAADPHTGYMLESNIGTGANNYVQLNASSQLPAVSAALLTNFPTLNQNTSGTAAGLSGTPNVTIGTVSAGAGGFTVDADGDATAKSLNITKVPGVAGEIALSEANSTDTHGAGFRGPASITGDGAYQGQFANARPTEAAFQVWGASISGTGTATDPYIHSIPFITLGPLFEVAGSTIAFKSTAAPNVASISFGADPATDAGGGPRLGNNMAIYWKAASGDNIPIAVDSSDIIQMGQNASGINLNSAPVTGLSLDTGGSNNAITVPLNGLLDGSITDPADADDMIYVRSQKAITITDIYCVAQGGGTITLTLQECDNATCASPSTIEGAITCDADGAEDDGTLTDGAIAAGAWIKVLFSAPTGTVTSLAWSVDGVQTW